MARKDTLVTQLGPNGAGPAATPFNMSASFVTPPTVVRNLDNCSYQINITTTDSIGTFEVQVSNDYQVNGANDNVVENPGNWTALTLAGGVPFASAAKDTIVINLNQLPFYAVRLAYTSTTAGTGTCEVFITDKQVGG